MAALALALASSLSLGEMRAEGEDLLAGGLPVGEIERSEPVNFADEVFPVLKRNCLACHNATKSKAGLNLESPATMKAGGDSGPALVPGESGDSLVFLTAAHLEEPEMPPAKNKSNARPLTPRELGLLKRWIDEGAQGDALVGADVDIDWRIRASEEDPILHVAVSEDGRLLACARGNRIFVYHLGSGRLEAVLDDPALAPPADGERVPVSHLDFVQSLAFSPSGDLVSGGFRTVKVWRRAFAEPAEAAAGRGFPWPKVRVDAGAADGSSDVVCGLPDGRRAVLGDAEGRVFLADREGVAELGRRGAAVRLVAPEAALAESPVLVTVDAGGEAAVWSLGKAEPAEPRVFPIGGGAAFVAAAPSGDRLASWHPAESRLTLWDLGTGEKVADLDLAAAEAAESRLSEQRAVVAADLLAVRTKDREAAVAALEGERKTRDEKVAAETAAREARDGKAAELAEAVAKVEELQGAIAAAEAGESDQLEGMKKALEEAGKARDARQGELDGLERELVAATRNRELGDRLVQRAEEELSQRQTLETEGTASHERAAATREAAAAAVEAARAAGVADAAFSASATGSLAVVQRGDGALLTFDGATGAFLDRRPASEAPVGGWAGFNLRGEPLGFGEAPTATEGGRPVVVRRSLRPRWTLATTVGRPDEPRPLVDRVSALDVSRDGRFLAIGTGIPSRSGELLLWDLEKNEAVWSNADAHSDSIDSAAFSPDGRWVATASADRLVKIFDAESGALVRQFEGHGSYATTVAWRADGLRLASAGTDNTVRIWEAETGKVLETRKEFSKGVNAVDFLGAGNQVVVASGDPSLRIDNDVLFNAGDYLHAAACDAAGSVVAGGGQDGVLRVWSVPDKKLVAEFGPGGGGQEP